MTQFESSIKIIPANIEIIFNTISDLKNLEKIKDRLPVDKIQDFSCDTDSCSFSINPVGSLGLRIIEREPYKTIKFETEKSPVSLFLWIQLLPVTDQETKIKITCRAELNMLIKGMVSKPLQDGIEKLADMLTTITYDKKIFHGTETLGKECSGKCGYRPIYSRERQRNGSLSGPVRHIGLYCPHYYARKYRIIDKNELDILTGELRNIYTIAEKGEFIIEDGIEDVHSQVELMLTRKLGDIGKKIHSGRSRNDQVLVDLKLFIRSEIKTLVELSDNLINALIRQSDTYKNILMPGYTHLQVAMPSSFGLWFGAYAESLVDDLTVMQAAYRICNRNPLGSAAGYGSSFPLNRTMTTRLLGFDSMDYNVVYAQMGRGKTERIVASAMGSIAATLSKLAFDACLFNSQNFGFIKLPDEYTTGSSIMPHKKNPDVFELTRAKCNKIQALPYQITLISNNLPSGYFRDLQIIKEVFLPAFDELKECLRMVTEMMSHMTVNTHILDDDKYKLIFSVEEVNRLTLSGVPFRDAYKQVGLSIEAGTFEPDKHVQHTHEGSIGNLCNDRISLLKQQVIDGFDFNKIETAEAALLGKS